jgi:aspartyl-tRNA(Asn)/glutamyl-tRNA(Gln) amidotransferase subunit A
MGMVSSKIIKKVKKVSSDQNGPMNQSNQSARHTELCAYNLQLMTNAEENLWSRREFVKSTLAGAAGSLIVGIDKAAGHAIAPQHNPQGSSLTKLSLSEASQLVRSKKVSPVELTKGCLSYIERLNPKLNAFITVTADSALAQARKAEDQIQRGRWSSPLHGIPIALKDLVDTAGVRTTAASGLFKDRVPSQDAEIVRRLKAGGAVLLGKLNMHEFAYGSSSVISYFGPVRNPWALDYMAGGSSSGSAVALAAELCYGAIGSDTGGSIRQPAAYCGIVGLKPTYGRVSTRGVIPLAWSLDHLGPMTRTVSDAALMLQAIAGYDSEDATSTDIAVADYVGSLAAKTSSLRIGIPRAHFYEGLHPEIRTAMDTALSLLTKLTSSQRDIEIPSSIETQLLITKVEAYAYHREYVTRTPELYQAETLKRIRAGAEISAAEYVYSRRQLDQSRRSIPKVFDAVDLLVTPTTPVPPFMISELLADIDNLRTKEVLTSRNTRPFNLLGLPTISVPCGFTSEGLPIGMQIAGPPGGEATVLRLAYAYELATEWHNRRPNLG